MGIPLLMKTTTQSGTSGRVINMAAGEFLGDRRFRRPCCFRGIPATRSGHVRVQTGRGAIANRLTYHRRRGPGPLTNCLQLFSRSNSN